MAEKDLFSEGAPTDVAMENRLEPLSGSDPWDKNVLALVPSLDDESNRACTMNAVNSGVCRQAGRRAVVLPSFSWPL